MRIEPLTVSRTVAASTLGVSRDFIDTLSRAGKLEKVQLSRRKSVITWRSIVKLLGMGDAK
jgi:hypothetical protein